VFLFLEHSSWAGWHGIKFTRNWLISILVHGTGTQSETVILRQTYTHPGRQTGCHIWRIRSLPVNNELLSMTLTTLITHTHTHTHTHTRLCLRSRIDLQLMLLDNTLTTALCCLNRAMILTFTIVPLCFHCLTINRASPLMLIICGCFTFYINHE